MDAMVATDGGDPCASCGDDSGISEGRGRGRYCRRGMVDGRESMSYLYRSGCWRAIQT